VRVLMRVRKLMGHILCRLVVILGVLRVYHGLNARYPLLWHVAACICGKMSFGHTRGQHVRRARFFIEVRNAYTAVFVVVVGTIILLLLRGPIGLCQVLKPLLHTLHHISMQYEGKRRLFGVPFARRASTSRLHGQRECSTSHGALPCMLVPECPA
jgi:hypothetical protein